MRNAVRPARGELQTTQARLRRRALEDLSAQLRAETAARKAPDMARLIGFGLLLLAALLIVIGTASA
jgi:hypothetical protein